MVNYIWVGMFVIGIVFGMVNGTMDQVNEALFVSAKEAVTFAWDWSEHTCLLAGFDENCGGIGAVR